MNGLEEEFGGEMRVVRLNAGDGDNAALQAQYGVRGHPSFVILDGSGTVVERFFGPQSDETLRLTIEQALDLAP
ncbi:MAG: hypothetical protein RRC07_01255 [Anaerolineae bacterium]|nr:hypothetical protein [Anaerolineae bacterium]